MPPTAHRAHLAHLAHVAQAAHARPVDKDGQVVQTIQALPDPTNQQGMLLSVDSGGTLFYENAGAHTAAHGLGQAGQADGVLGSAWPTNGLRT